MDGVLEEILSQAARRPDDLCVKAVSERFGDRSLRFGDLGPAAAAAAGSFRAWGVREGDVVVLMGTHNVDLYPCWLGALWLGAIPTVLAEPSVRVERMVYERRLEALMRRVEARLLAFDGRYAGDFNGRFEAAAHTYEEAVDGTFPAPDRVRPSGKDVVLLQHSSGTTGLQKGVVLTHEAVLGHRRAYEAALGIEAGDIVASWLPLYHDMGFIACFLDPLLAGVPVVWLSPFEWVANPSSLLAAVSAHRASLIWLPNFAFEVLARRTPEPPGSFDLSSLRAVVNCSEPITAEAMERFAARFRDDGLRPEALHTCFAMAENVFAVCSSSAADPPRRRVIDRKVWREEHRAMESAGGAGTAVHVSSGAPAPGCEVKVAGPHGESLPAGQAGRVLIRSPFLFSGYFRRPDLQEDLFDAVGFFDTGDTGYLDAEGHLYVTGRTKDLIIVGGRNVYPQDVEEAIASLDGICPGRVVSFGVDHPTLGTEAIVALAESTVPEGEWPRLERRIRRTLPGLLDLDLLDARIVTRGSLRKSTSGKLARAGNRDWYLEGRFGNLPKILENES